MPCSIWLLIWRVSLAPLRERAVFSVSFQSFFQTIFLGFSASLCFENSTENKNIWKRVKLSEIIWKKSRSRPCFVLDTAKNEPLQPWKIRKNGVYYAWPANCLGRFEFFGACPSLRWGAISFPHSQGVGLRMWYRHRQRLLLNFCMWPAHFVVYIQLCADRDTDHVIPSSRGLAVADLFCLIVCPRSSKARFCELSLHAVSRSYRAQVAGLVPWPCRRAWIYFLFFSFCFNHSFVKLWFCVHYQPRKRQILSS